jgi:hypothetical protein
LSNDREPTVLDQFGLQRLYPRNRLFSSQGQHAACAVQPSARRSLFATVWVDPLPGCCMFATGVITEGSENRICSLTEGFCPAQSFKDLKVFQVCVNRTGSLRKEKERP